MLMGILHTSGRAAMRGVANGGFVKKEKNKKKSGGTNDCRAMRAPPTAGDKDTLATPAEGVVLGAERLAQTIKLSHLRARGFDWSC
jgi:hypothetical protein